MAVILVAGFSDLRTHSAIRQAVRECPKLLSGANARVSLAHADSAAAMQEHMQEHPGIAPHAQ